MTTKHKDTRRSWKIRNGCMEHSINGVLVDQCNKLAFLPCDVVDLLNRSYELGRQDEFDDSARRAQKIFDEFGI